MPSPNRDSDPTPWKRRYIAYFSSGKRYASSNELRDIYVYLLVDKFVLQKDEPLVYWKSPNGKLLSHWQRLYNGVVETVLVYEFDRSLDQEES